MFDEFNGLLAKVFLSSGDQVTGIISKVEQDGSFITLINAMYTDKSGNKKNFAEKKVKGSEVEDLELVESASSQLDNLPPTDTAQKSTTPKRKETSSWVQEDVKNIQNEEFDFERNLKLFDKAKFTQEQREKMNRDSVQSSAPIVKAIQQKEPRKAVASDPIAVSNLSKSPVADELTERRIESKMPPVKQDSFVLLTKPKPSTLAEEVADRSKEPAVSQNAPVKKQILSRTVPRDAIREKEMADERVKIEEKSKLDENATLKEQQQISDQMEKLQLTPKSRHWLPIELRIENASFSATMFLQQHELTTQGDIKLNLFCNASEPEASSLAIATLRQLLLRTRANEIGCINACVYLESELFLFPAQVLSQLKYFHEAGGEILSASPQDLATFTLTNENDLIMFTSATTVLGSNLVASYGFSMGNPNGSLFKKVNRVLAASIDVGEKFAFNERLVLLNDGNERFLSCATIQ